MERDPRETMHVGAMLAQARLRHGLTISEIASRTKVSTRYLHAIEDNAFHEIPSRVHTLGFARSFAKCVRLDADEIAEAIRSSMDAHAMPDAAATHPATGGRSKRDRVAMLATAVWARFSSGASRRAD